MLRVLLSLGLNETDKVLVVFIFSLKIYGFWALSWVDLFLENSYLFRHGVKMKKTANLESSDNVSRHTWKESSTGMTAGRSNTWTGCQSTQLSMTKNRLDTEIHTEGSQTFQDAPPVSPKLHT